MDLLADNGDEHAKAFSSLRLAVATVSVPGGEHGDSSGKLLAECIEDAGHKLVEKMSVPDDVYRIRALVSRWIAEPVVQAMLISGGTGVTGQHSTPEAVMPLLDHTIDGFGELFRWLSYQQIQTSAIQSRALAGIANGTLIFCLPGSPRACQLAWEQILCQQLDSRTLPCNFADLHSAAP